MVCIIIILLAQITISNRRSEWVNENTQKIVHIPVIKFVYMKIYVLFQFRFPLYCIVGADDDQ